MKNLYFEVTEDFVADLQAMLKRLQRDDYLRQDIFQTEDVRRVFEHITSAKFKTLRELCEESLSSTSSDQTDR